MYLEIFLSCEYSRQKYFHLSRSMLRCGGDPTRDFNVITAINLLYKLPAKMIKVSYMCLVHLKSIMPVSPSTFISTT